MIDSTGSVPALPGQDRRRAATRPLTDATGIGCGTVWRPASALAGHRRDRLVESTIQPTAGRVARMTDGPQDGPDRLEARLREDGVPDAVIAAARAEGRLPGLAVEAALGGRGRHSLSWTAQKAGVPAPYLREVLRAAGRPNPVRGELAFTDDDLEF